MYISKVINSVIAITNYKGKEYAILNNSGTINYASIENGILNHEIENESIVFLQELYNVIKFDFDNAVYCGKYRINGKLFDIFQDKISRIYTFVLNYKNKKAIPNSEDTVLLNYYFNNQNVIYTNIDEVKDENYIKNKKKRYKFFKKLLRVGGITVFTFISTAIITYNLPQSAKNILYSDVGTILKGNLINKNASYTFDDIKIAIEKNNNIPKDDKKFIEDVFYAEFEENKNYINTENVIKKLETLGIEYHKYYNLNDETGEYEVTHKVDLPDNVAAYYEVNTNTMVCLEDQYNKELNPEKLNKSFGFNETVKSVYYHELNHAFTTFEIDNCLWKNNNHFAFEKVSENLGQDDEILEDFSDELKQNFNSVILTETINEIFTQEYVDKYYQQNKNEKAVMGYSDSLPYMYCLAEILPNEVLREFKFNDNDSVIVDGLINISNNKAEAYKLITSLKCINLYDSLVNEVISTNEINQINSAKLEQQENYKRIHDGLSYMYKAKYNKDMSDDICMLSYLYNTPVITDVEKEKVINYFGISNENTKINVKPKGYFSQNYIKANPNIVVRYIDKNKNIKFVELEDNKDKGTDLLSSPIIE